MLVDCGTGGVGALVFGFSLGGGGLGGAVFLPLFKTVDLIDSPSFIVNKSNGESFQFVAALAAAFCPRKAGGAGAGRVGMKTLGGFVTRLQIIFELELTPAFKLKFVNFFSFTGGLQRKENETRAIRDNLTKQTDLEISSNRPLDRNRING
uniref:Uncharacterized protein n=1 Tax=Glossina brevipalpis TaxID=37001 RepID=A0A1A9WRW4_9MUSC